ncbi:hypothetical protein, partial [Nostoc commune]|uniref:hypothetical protein n=1 Tax=Nostoc commune TaxID=1178 RepID=UPI001E43E00E
PQPPPRKRGGGYDYLILLGKAINFFLNEVRKMNKSYIIVYIRRFINISKYQYMGTTDGERLHLNVSFNIGFIDHSKKFMENQLIHNFD